MCLQCQSSYGQRGRAAGRSHSKSCCGGGCLELGRPQPPGFLQDLSRAQASLEHLPLTQPPHSMVSLVAVLPLEGAHPSQKRPRMWFLPLSPSYLAILPGLVSIFPSPNSSAAASCSWLPSVAPPLRTFLTFSQRHTHSSRNGLLVGVALAITTNLHVLWSLSQLALSSGLST